ncbi:MAG: hypothetical protein Q9217_000548 [Psora testacea]
MPPFIPQKRPLPSPPLEAPISKFAAKPNLFETADKPNSSATLRDNKAFLDGLGTSDDGSSLSDVSSDEFENAISPPSAKKRKTDRHGGDEDDIDWEDAIDPEISASATAAPPPSEHLELNLDQSAQIRTLTHLHKKKGPSKIERQIRFSTHCMHVQFLLFHNLIRNGWACDSKAQRILVDHLPTGLKNEVDKWRVDSGMEPVYDMHKSSNLHNRGRKANKALQNERNQRDWGKPAVRQEKGAPNMSRGDPLLRLLKLLAAYWRKRFTITAPGLRKQGYKPLPTLEDEIASWRNAKHIMEEYGERVKDIEDFRKLASLCEGSRDVGAQLFTTLVRALGLEARLVASLQPIGYGWNKNEDATAKKKRQTHKMQQGLASEEAMVAEKDEDEDEEAVETKAEYKPKRAPSSKRGRPKGEKDAPIDLVDSLGNSDSAEWNGDGDDDRSVIDVSPSIPQKKPNANYDQDMPAPTYWTEVISPITNEVHPVDPFALTPAVVTSPEHIAQFEPRGAKAEKAKQVIAYVIAYSPDGTAKEVTTRYLKRHMWPGRTRGVRIPVEKVPVYDLRGKIKHYEEYDWFKTVISGYRRTQAMRTAVDDLEEAKDLKHVKPEKKKTNTSEETLQGYKTSAKFVLERHLRREEALRPGVKPVKTFATGKGENAKEEPVYRRADVEICRTGESWHKEGRAVKPGEYPMKKVPVRAVTMTRKREVEEAERDGGEKLMQGMYARGQTDWIIPRPIENGVIPKNAFGNMDCYVPSMVPKGAVHIPLRSTVRICKRLGIDYAEAVTGFEFGKRMAVPIITGVVVAEENEHAVIDEWRRDEEERKIKEEGKREKTALAAWRKWLMGLRIIHRMKEEYGNDAEAHIKEDTNPFTNPGKAKTAAQSGSHEDDPPKQEENVSNETTAGGFVANDADHFRGGGFLLEGHKEAGFSHHDSELIIENGVPLTNDHVSPHPLPPRSTPRGRSIQNIDIVPAPNQSKKTPMSNGERSEDNGAKPSNVRSSKTRAKPEGKHSASPPLNRSIHDETQEAPHILTPKPTTAASRRQPARKATTVVKSHYFEHDSDESSKTDCEDFESSTRKKRGRPARKGRASIDIMSM